MKTVTIDNVEYYSRTAPRGYGYEIIKSEKVGDNKTKRSLYFTTYNKELINSIFGKMEETQKLPEALPNTSSEIPPPKVLVFDTKHYRYHYFVNTPERLRKTCIKILKERHDEGYYYIPTEPINVSGIDSLDDLDTIPEKFSGMKKDFERKFKEYQEEVRDYKSDMVYFNRLQKILDDDDDVNIGFVWGVISEFECESIRLEDMEVVD